MLKIHFYVIFNHCKKLKQQIWFVFGSFVLKLFKKMKIAIGNDHVAPKYNHAIVQFLENQGHQVTNYGATTFDSVDYPDFAHKVAQDVTNGLVDYGILLCGTGNGITMTANKYPKVRAGLCWTKEIAVLVRQHNDANILSIPARFTSIEQAVEMVATFLTTDFEGGRHQARVDKIGCF